MNISYSGASFPMNPDRTLGVTASGLNLTAEQYNPFNNLINTGNIPTSLNNTTLPPFNLAPIRPEATNFPTEMHHHVTWNTDPCLQCNQANMYMKPTTPCLGPYQSILGFQPSASYSYRNLPPTTCDPQIHQPSYMPFVCPPSCPQQVQQPQPQSVYSSPPIQSSRHKFSYPNNYNGPTTTSAPQNNNPFFTGSNGMYPVNRMNGNNQGAHIGPSTPLHSNYYSSRYTHQNQNVPMNPSGPNGLMNQQSAASEYYNNNGYGGPTIGPSNMDPYQQQQQQQRFNSFNKPVIYPGLQPNNMQQQVKYDNQAMQYRLEQERLYRLPQFQLKFHQDGQTSTTDIRYYNQRYIPVAFRIQTENCDEQNADCSNNIYKNYTPLVYNNDESSVFKTDNKLTFKDEASQKTNQNNDSAQTDVEMEDVSVPNNKSENYSEPGPSNYKPLVRKSSSTLSEALLNHNYNDNNNNNNNNKNNTNKNFKNNNFNNNISNYNPDKYNILNNNLNNNNSLNNNYNNNNLNLNNLNLNNSMNNRNKMDLNSTNKQPMAVPSNQTFEFEITPTQQNRPVKQPVTKELPLLSLSGSTWEKYVEDQKHIPKKDIKTPKKQGKRKNLGI